jgi:peptidoglycan/LPS O-acetylase OafA/YrhL
LDSPPGIRAEPTSEPAPARAPRREHLPSLDGLRGLAVLLVVWHHLPDSVLGPALETAKFALRPGYLGVDVFFVLSGFLITRILLVDKAAGRPLRGFLWRRFARIFPIYYLLIGVLAVWDPGGYLGWCATYTCNWLYAIDKTPSPMEHAWSLCVEEHFYLAWPFVAYGLTAANARRVILFGIFPVAVVGALAMAFLEPSLHVEVDGLIYRLTPFRIVSLGLGAMFAMHERALRASARKLAGWIAVLGIAGLVVIPTVLLVSHRWVGPIMLVGFALFSGSIVLVAIAANDRGGPLRELLVQPRLRWVGRISYGLYLYHVPIYFAFGVMGSDPATPPTLARCFLAIVTAFVIAAGSYRFLERPILKLAGSSLIAPREGARAVAPGAPAPGAEGLPEEGR